MEALADSVREATPCRVGSSLHSKEVQLRKPNSIMRRYAQTILLKDDPELIRQYVDYHAHPWPEIAEGMRNSGVQRAYIYRVGLVMFMIVETDEDAKGPGLSEATQARLNEWDVLMQGFQEAMPGLPADAPRNGKWTLMEEIYTFEQN